MKDHEEMPLAWQELVDLNTLNKRRDALANKYTNAVGYGALGIGLKEAIDYIIELEDRS